MSSPVGNTIITSIYGETRGSSTHKGVDYGVSTGTPVKSQMTGKVTYAGWQTGYGNIVIVEGNGITQKFAHLSAFSVKVGDTVSAGTVVAKSGNTGDSTGPHLHYEVLVNGKNVDPVSYQFMPATTSSATELLSDNNPVDVYINKIGSGLTSGVLYGGLIILAIISLLGMFINPLDLIKKFR
jgi:murein DD-endopeptidase MepM/ murein hydrolase activator NlpD